MLKVENAPGWVKDPSNKAVLNTDLSALEQRKLDKKKNTQINIMESDIRNVKTELSDLKSEITDIKTILLEFINSKNNL